MSTTHRAGRLRCELLVDPLAVHDDQPRLSWEPAVTPAAHQVQVASSPGALAEGRADRWDSGRVDGDACATRYAGAPVVPGDAAWWRVRVWQGTDAGEPAWSEPATWEPGLRGGWRGSWITAPPAPYARDTYRPCPLLRGLLDLPAAPTRARLYVTALGLVRASVNGRVLGAGRLRPGWTDYTQRVQYDAHDVTALLQPGENAVGLVLGEGWYSGHFGIDPRRANWGPHPQARAHLAVECEDGTSVVFATDGSWRWSYGPILTSDLLQGESYDARQEQPGWDAPGFAAGGWSPVVEAEDRPVAIVAPRAEPTAACQELEPVAVTEPVFSTYVVDFGQNLVGWCRLKVDVAEGTEIVVRHGEALHPDGTVYTANLRAATSVERYVARGGGEETFEPSFTLHGFRYVEITGIQAPYDPTQPPRLPPSTVTAVVVHAAMEEAGSFACSDDLVNRIHANSLWSLRGNFVEVPTDCPQRNERFGWLGDARIFSRTACFLYDAQAFFTKWLEDARLGRTPDGFFPDFAPWVGPAAVEGGPGWSDAGVFVPWLLYETYADEAVLEESFDSMAAFVDAVHAANPSLLREHRNGMSWGDWLSLPEANPDEGRGGGMIIDSVHSTTDKVLFATAFFARSAELLGRAAGVLGRRPEEERYLALGEAIRSAWVKAYVRDDGTLLGDTQTAYALALCFDLVPDDLRPAMGASLARAVERAGHLTTGITGTELLLPALTAAGRLDLAYMLLLHRGYPSWGYTIDHGATTVWERWDGWTEEGGFQDIRMNSFNHYALGSEAAWIHEVVGGLGFDPSVPGERRLVVHPRPGGGITWAKARHRTTVGWAEVAWRLDGERLHVEVDVPPGATAIVVLPDRQEEAGPGRHTLEA